MRTSEIRLRAVGRRSQGLFRTVLAMAMIGSGAVGTTGCSLVRFVSPPVYDHQTRTQLRLPFDGSWCVGWGGRSENKHLRDFPPTLAYDFLVDDHYRCQGLEDWLGGASLAFGSSCLGDRILAPAAGIVVKTRKSSSDNPRDKRFLEPANEVQIDHGNGEISVLLHFQQDSVVVDVGDSVKQGQHLGDCGNSGRSSEPHLHCHLEDAETRRSIRAVFQDYIADGEEVSQGEPQTRQTVEPQD